MATTVLLRDDQGRPWRITLTGRSVITGEGSSQVVQELDDPASARAHFESVLLRRRRDRYTLVEVKELDQGDPLLTVDPLSDRAKWEPDRGWLTITFKESADRGLCDAVVARIQELQPRVVHLLCDPASPGESLADALLSATLGSVEALILDTYWLTVTRQRRHLFGDLAEVFEALPNLRRAFITGAIKATPFAHSRLEELYLLGDPLPEGSLAALAESHLPGLTALGLGLAGDSGPVAGGSALAALSGLGAPRLREVELAGVDGIVAFLGGAASLPAGLLDGGRLAIAGEIEDEDALLSTLAAVKPRLRGLGSLVLPLADALSIDGDAAARGLLPNLVDSEDHATALLPERYLEW